MRDPNPTMKLQRDLEGYVRIDNRESPGIDGHPAYQKNTLFESATFTCSHCQRVVIVNPKRNRERAYCRSCDHLICDSCESERVLLAKPCKPFKQIIDELIDSIMKGLPYGT